MDKIIINKNTFPTLVAVTREEHEKGLMHQPWPPPIMVFPYKSSNIRKFWMKNTCSPLDIVFANQGKVIDIFKGKPYDCTLLGPNVPVDLVAEFPLGFAEKYSFAQNDNIEVMYSLKSLAKMASNIL